MDPEMEFEIDLKDLLYRVLVRWRLILRGALIIALLVGALRLVNGLISRYDPEALTRAQNKYTYELLDYEATGESLQRQIDNLQDDSEQQQLYNEKSALMEIDPLNKWVGSFVLYVDADYRIDPALSFQNTDPTQRLVAAYSSYLGSGEFYMAILDRTEIVDEIRFLQEILSRSADMGSATITVTCVGKSEANVTEILDLVKEKLLEKSETFRTTIGDHNIGFLTESMYTTIDLDLDQKQKKNLLKINEYGNKIGELNLEMEEWEKTPKPKAKYGTVYSIKQAVKSTIIGGIAGCFIMAGYFAMVYLFSPAVKTDSDMNILGITVLGSLRRKTGEKKETKFEAWLDKHIITPLFDRWVVRSLGGRANDIDEKVQERLLVNNLNGVLKEKGLAKAAIVAVMDEEDAKATVKRLDAVDKKVPYVYAGDPLTDPDTVKRLEDSSDVVLMTGRYRTRIDDIQKTGTLLKACGKSILGAVIVEDVE